MITKEKAQDIIDNVGEYVGSPADSVEIIIDLCHAVIALRERLERHE